MPIDRKCGLAAGKQLGYSLSLSRHHALSGMPSSECQTGKRPGDWRVTTAAPCRAVHGRQRKVNCLGEHTPRGGVGLSYFHLDLPDTGHRQQVLVTNASKSRR